MTTLNFATFGLPYYMKVRDFKSKISCCFNSECDVIEVVCVYVQCYLINMSASYSRIGAFYVTLEVDYFAMKNFPKKSLAWTRAGIKRNKVNSCKSEKERDVLH